MRKALKVLVGILGTVGVLAALALGYLSTQVTVRGPVLHAIAGIGGAQPTSAQLAGLRLAPGFTASLYAEGLGPARVLRFTDTGDLLVSITRAGSILLVERDADGDGRADGVRTLLQGLDRPHGIDVAEGWLYFAETGAVRRVRFDAAARAVSGAPEAVAALAGGGMHFTRTLRVGPDRMLYVSSGSSCNVCIETTSRAAMLRVDPQAGAVTPFAEGLRNTVGFDWQPGSGALFGVDNGRDLLGDDFPPDELNGIVAGGFYGWPFWHGDNLPDPEYGTHPGAAGRAPIAPAHAFGAHVAALSINFSTPTARRPVSSAPRWSVSTAPGTAACCRAIGCRPCTGPPTGASRSAILRSVSCRGQGHRPAGGRTAGSGPGGVRVGRLRRCDLPDCVGPGDRRAGAGVCAAARGRAASGR